MTSKLADQSRSSVRFEADENAPHALSLGVGFQSALLVVTNVVLISAIVIRAAGGSDFYLAWATFACLVICGVITVVQVLTVGRVGSGYVLSMAASGSFMAISVTALSAGGPGLFALLVLTSSLFLFLLAGQLPLLRRIITPTVAGTTIILVTVTIMPIIFRLLADIPAGGHGAAAPVIAAVTVLAVTVTLLRGSAFWRIWAPIIGIVAGCAVAALFGVYDMEAVIAADWFGVPSFGWEGLRFDFGPAFWVLLPAFVFVTLVDGVATIGDTVATQQVSWRRPRATDFNSVQGGVSAVGVANLVSGLAGSMPCKFHPSSAAIAGITGVASRRVGVYVGVILLVLAFLPKMTALLLAVPNPVIAGYTLVIMGLLFMSGVRVVSQGGIDSRKATVVGVSFWIGIGFENDLIFADLLSAGTSDVLGSGIVAGGLAAILMTIFMEVTARRGKSFETDLEAAALPRIREFLGRVSSSRGWGSEMTDRLCLVAEETLQILLDWDTDGQAGERGRLRLVVRPTAHATTLEFVAATGEGNIQDRVALLADEPQVSTLEHEVSLRLLRHFASSVRHQQYRGVEIVTVEIDTTPPARPASRP